MTSTVSGTCSGKRVIITCGPASEPVDSVRRITNHSTGALGNLLCAVFAREGWYVHCFRGSGATTPEPVVATELNSFSTNSELQTALERVADTKVDVILHAAALSDFVVDSMEDDSGQTLDRSGGKLPSELPGLRINLRPAKKVLPLLRGLFPDAAIVGWKYEVVGTKASLLEKMHRQIESTGADACVGNGPALEGSDGLGEKMLWVSRRGEERMFESRAQFAECLPELATELCVLRSLEKSAD